MRTRVLYFSAVNIGGLTVTNGGNLCCRNHIRRLKQDPKIDLHVVIAGLPGDESSNREFLGEQGVPHHFITLKDPTAKQGGPLGRLRNSMTGNLRYLHEESARLNRHVESELSQALSDWKIDSIVVDYLPSTLYCKRLLNRGDIVLITLNREGPFFRDLRQLGLTGHGRIGGWISQLRWDRYERWAYRKAAKVVSIGEPDLPRISGLRSEPVCVTPYLDAMPNRWRFTNSKSALFVGNIHHYPNRLAIEWLSTKLAPALAKLDPEIVLEVIGAEPSQVPENWRLPNVHFAGVSTRQHVAELFSTSDLFICPIQNDYGMKFKVAEALAYGIPMLASTESLLAVPYLSEARGFDLHNPQDVAARVKQVIGNEDELNRLHAAQTRQQNEFIKSQTAIWSSVIESTRQAA